MCYKHLTGSLHSEKEDHVLGVFRMFGLVFLLLGSLLIP